MEREEIAARLAGLSPAKRALLERRRRGEAPAAAQVSGIGRRRDSGPAPLSFAQQRLWFLDQLEPGAPTYNLRVLLRLAGPLDRQALLRSFQEVVRRHEVLRTAFEVEAGVPVQAVLPRLELALPVLDLTALPRAARDQESLRRTRELAVRGFDLTRPPLIRATLVALAAGEHRLLVVMHHIVSDGWSSGVLVREVGALYEAFLAGRPSPLPELPIQYADFAVWQRGWLAAEVREQQLGYWRARLAGMPAGLDLPTDRPRPAGQSFRGATCRFALDAGLTETVTLLARRAGVTPFMVLASGLFALLARLSGQCDLAIGSPSANRDRPEIEGLIGFFVNTLVLRTDVGVARDFLALLSQVREVTLGAQSHQDLPFEELVTEIHPDRDLSRTPLFQVALALHNQPLLESTVAGLDFHPEELPVDSAKFDLAFILGEESGVLAGTLEYATDLYDHATAGRLCGHWVRLLAAAAADPGADLERLELLSPAERHQLLREWNDTRAAAAGDALLHQLFEARADLHPRAPAALWEGESLTYGELEARANRLANLLRRLGAGPRAPVAVWMERSLDMLVGLLGTAKAGAAYLPIDGGWPSDRARAVLAGTEAGIVLTRRSHLPAVQELQWQLPHLAEAVCLDVEAPQPPPEPLDLAGVRELWDAVAERASDWVTAAGFWSSYTGEPFSAAEVMEYRDRVVALAEPWLGPERRVLEIGAGSGLILWELASRVKRYVGLDPSARTQERNRERAGREGRGNVELRTGFAHEIEALEPGSFDLVILASTAQFFPGLIYLERVLELALSRLAPGGAVVVADVMDPRRREELRRSLADYAAAHPDSAAARNAGRAGEVRQPLHVDEGFFLDLTAALPAAEARVLHRQQGFANELGFRYDVILRKGASRAAAAAGAAMPAPVPAQAAGRSKRIWTGWHVARSGAERPRPLATPADVAYVIHTSGSTGEPKGIVVQHRPAVELVRWVNSRFGVGPGDRLLFVTSPAFDLSVYDVFGVLGAGGEVQVASEAALRDPERLARLLLEGPVTVWDSAPAALQQLVPLLPGPARSGAEGPRLRLVLLSGDWIPVPLPDLVRASFPRAQVISLGGATEATVWSNWYPIGEVDPRWPSIPYGRPIANAAYHVLDRALQPAAIGVPGDLYIGGGCLCVGYARLPEVTAERFIPDPFAGEAGARLYATGDRARHGRDGNLEFLGRVDQQVKVRGYRIELEEIEAVLARHPGVREAAVVAREDVPGDKRLVGYVVPAVRPAPSPAELRSALQRSMPDYMVPWTFVTLASMPLTANGKLDRKALPAPREVADTGAGYVAPRNDFERAIAAAWQEVLKLPRVGANDSFFELGGSSLVATQVISRVREAFAVELPLRTLFEARTLAGLAERVEALRAVGPATASTPRPPGVPGVLGVPGTPSPAAILGSPGSLAQAGAPGKVGSPAQAGAPGTVEGPGVMAPPLVAGPRAGPPPLSFAQHRLWLIDQLEPGSPLYNIPGAVRLTGPLAPELLRGALGEVVRRHETLRTTFQAVDGQPVQVIAAELRPSMPVVDLAGLPAGQRDRETARVTAAEGRLPFDLAKGPLQRVTLLRLAREEHVALLTFHHIVADAWSVGIFLREIAAAFSAGSTGEPLPLAELPVQYADFAIWQRRWLAGEVLAGEVAYWKHQLAGMPRVLELPADRPRPPAQSFRGGSRPVALPAQAVTPLASWGAREGVTLFMTLLAAYAAVVGRYSAQEDLGIGSAIAGRDRREIEGLIGFFINTLVLRVDLAGDPRFDLLLDRVRAMALGAYAHQALPFEHVVEELAPVRDPSHSPLVQVAFTLQNTPAEPPRLAGLTLAPLPVASGTAKVDLLLSLAEAGGTLSGLWEYSTDLFDPVTVDRLSGHLATLLAGVAADPGRRISELPLLTTAERQQLLAEWNDTRADFSPQPFVHQMFAGHARRAPGAVALVDGRRLLTYGELDARAEALACRLRAAGVGPEVAVALCAERSLEMVLGAVAVLKAGGAYLPLDPSHPPERLAFMVSDSGAPVLLTQRQLASRLSPPPRPPQHPRHGQRQEDAPLVLLLDGDWGEARQPAGGAGAGEVAAEQAAYVIYTSGSTGRPKGVVVAHGSLSERVRWHHAWSGLAPGDHATQVAAPGFDATVFEIWPCLAAGACLHILDDETLLSPPRLVEWLASQRITDAWLPTPLAEVVLDEPWPAGMALREVHTAGDRLHRRPPPDLPFALFNFYGPTEATVLASGHRVAPARLPGDVGDAAHAAQAGHDGPPSIGRPISNARIHLLDRRLQPVPVGVPGEIVIGGAALARGYLGRPGLTAERFVPDPFAALAGEAGARLYRSGDLARLLPDGELDFLGRADQQVKIRGRRIELGEIEMALGEHPAVQACTVLVRQDAPGEKALVAYLAPREGQAPEVRELRAFLASKLPSYMVPAAFVTLPALPLSANGKVDRTVLPAPHLESAGRELVAPRTPAEATLCGIWAQVLRRREIGVHDNFFEHGGDSILCIQVVSRAQQAGLSLAARDLFQHQTVAELALAAEAAAAAEAAEAAAAAAGGTGAGGDVLLTPAQLSLLELELPGRRRPRPLDGAPLLDLREVVDPARLRRALREVVDRHAVLGCRFLRHAGQGGQGERGERAGGEDDSAGWRQERGERAGGEDGSAGWRKVCSAAEALLAAVDLSALPPARRRGALDTAVSWLRASLHLEQGALLRVALFALGGAEQRLLLVAHPLIADGVSRRILLADLEAAYRAIASGRDAALPPVPTSFQQWSARLDEHARSAVVAAELEYWLDASRTLVRPLPLDRPPAAGVPAAASAVVAELDAEETRALLQEVPPAYHSKLDDALLSALAQALAGWTGEPRLLVDVTGSGRGDLLEGVDTSRAVGCFTTLFPVLLEVDRTARNPGDHLKSIKEQLRAVPRGGIGYGLLRYQGGPAQAAKLQAMPAAEVAFSYSGEGLGGGLPGPSLFVPAPESAGEARRPRLRRGRLLEIDAEIAGGRLRLTWTYDEGLHDRSTIQVLADRCLGSLRSLIEHCLSGEAGGFTPSDFPEARFSQKDLDTLMAHIGKRKSGAGVRT
jgi:amino acid adenylation domain-containing protein/non-ribosomal peptide synthase protein (TIGR01720 family)